MSKLHFTKMHGTGNDYVYVNLFTEQVDDASKLAVFVSDRHFGIGGDGVILVCPSKVADAKMKMYNRDGSEGKMCGNGIRCVAKFMRDNGIVDKDEMEMHATKHMLEAISSIKDIWRHAEPEMKERMKSDINALMNSMN